MDRSDAEVRAELEELRRRNGGLEARVADLERRNASLEQDLRPFQVLADNIPDHVYFKDRDSRFLWVNRNLLKVRGFKERGELIGKTDFDIHPRDRAQTSFQDEQRILRTGEYLLNKLEADVDGDGQPMWMLTTKIPLRDAGGAIIGTCGISKDVTPQIQGSRPWPGRTP